jgi:hypothetical protein
VHSVPARTFSVSFEFAVLLYLLWYYLVSIQPMVKDALLSTLRRGQ